MDKGLMLGKFDKFQKLEGMSVVKRLREQRSKKCKREGSWTLVPLGHDRV